MSSVPDAARPVTEVPASTYRFQVTPEWPLTAAADQVDYLQRLGAGWVYLSPILQAEPGSAHGYDVVDHGRTDSSRGGEAGLAAVADRAHAAGLGVLVDIVPNHVGVATPAESVWFWDVLAKGRQSPHADAFDVDWEVSGGRIRLPVLGDGPDELDQLEVSDGELRYYDHRFPIAEGTGGGTPRQVHDRQHYELINWRRGDAELNYRRFFAVSTLAGVRVELPEVFDASHAEVGRWVQRGWVDGLRIDHPDGLADPKGYLDQLAELLDGRYVLVEKIIEGDERLPSSWRTAGTTGYDALAWFDRVLIDPAGEAGLDALDTALRGGMSVEWPAMVRFTKRAVADGILRAEVLRLARLVPDLPQADDGIAELLASFDVYRTYLPDGAEHLDHAVQRATVNRPELTELLAELSRRLRDTGTEFSRRFQQTSGMVMAKGVEDCAFYRWTRLTSLTEVGAEPAQFSIPVEQFHVLQAERQERSPVAMTTLSTHDTKRAEDVRSRISVLAEVPDEWTAAVRRWNRWAPLDDGPLANLLWQAAVGAWPIERERLHAYAEKASREAGTSTQWTDSDEAFEQRMHALVDAVFDDDELHVSVRAFADRVTGPGRSNSLSEKLIQLTAPGVPDVYQGSELWDLSLVDPDNRRPVDYRRRADLLARLDDGWQPDIDDSGAAKLLVVSHALRLRRDRPDLFTGYTPLSGDGSAAEHLVGFDRGGAITLATRLPVGLARRGGWADTTVTLPEGRWVDQLTGREHDGGSVRLADVLERYPVALLAPAS
ncbi:malto-oligosyltrehalose synthase [Nakamurella leprariae]|uniref:Malto-oligosyltrehalose synthase n=1 Tax=Nakamurella leprariae TaxID=2803911 RepID=A0A938YA80_9ACTN|nr:malto-oligosyltrehalose synthase [Nakamurella leprariae]MBM9466054.1 malto-oligosyltrehalose synthase [Nakamurella leprariae]